MNTASSILLSLALLVPAHAPDHASEMREPTAQRSVGQRKPGLTDGPLSRRIRAAAPGDTITVPAGVYREHLVIDKPLTLIAQGKAVLDGAGSGDIVEISAPDVTLRGFILRDTGIDLDKENAAIRVLAPRAIIEDNTLEDILFGIDLRQAPDSVIRNNRIGAKPLDIARRGDGIRLWRSDRCLIEHNIFHDGRDALLWYSNGITVRHNVARRCRYGLHLMFADDITIEHNEFTDNSVGVYLMYSKNVSVTSNRLVRNRGPSGYGLGLKEADRFTVSNNAIIGNRVGVYLDGSPFTTDLPGDFHLNTFAYNDVGLTFLPAVRGNRFTQNTFLDNIEQVSVSGRGTLAGNEFWSGDIGNFWSDYTAYDQDGNGVGDFVHEPQALFESMIDREPKLRLFLFSPAQQAIEFLGRALPTFRPDPKFVDEVPLMSPPRNALPVSQPTDPTPLASTGVALLVLSASLLYAARPLALADKRLRCQGTDA
ncbi:MAG: nitrous oxide reductase family maturation protein NosD [Phycisphaerales bacterium]